MTRFFAFSVALIGLLSTTACKKDAELDRDKFLGTYSVAENCNPGLPFDMRIFESTDGDNAVIITNFGNFAHNVDATVSGNAIVMETQSFTINSGPSPVTITLSGSGSIDGDALTIVYSYESPSTGAEITCIMTCDKQ